MALERRSPIQRRTRLDPGSAPLQRAPLQRGAGLSRSGGGRPGQRVEGDDDAGDDAAPVPAVPLARPPRYERDEPRRPESLAKPVRGGCGETEARRIVYARSGGVCEGCRRARATDWAHRVAEGQGGPWCPSNGMHLCRVCHDDDHRHPAAARRRGRMLESHQDPEREPVDHAAWGRVLLRPDGTMRVL